MRARRSKRALASWLFVGCSICVLIVVYRTHLLPASPSREDMNKSPDLSKLLQQHPNVSKKLALVLQPAKNDALDASTKLPERQRGDTVVVVIPFRDREGHLVKFKKYWRWFVKNQSTLSHTEAPLEWQVFVVEQFDSEAFNRGWNFNVGLAIASAQITASPDVVASMKISFNCAVIQDIDYLPEAGVDYADCSTPIQLSSEIDRYNYKTPYLKSAGGIVGMSLAHWQQINGFGNDYFGWGGEDDELYHRLRLNGLLFGDCYPFCTNMDKNIGKSGVSIRRPKTGHGRFTGKFMHSANHTKRVTDAALYKRNVAMVAEIENDGKRWRNDGLSNLAFRIISNEIDTNDQQTHGIVYHHVKVRRGRESYELKDISLAFPLDVCSKSTNIEWNIEDLGFPIPWDLHSLRARIARKLQHSGCLDVDADLIQRGSFILVDGRRCLAKILDDEDPRLLISFYRSLNSMARDSLIIFDLRPRHTLQRDFSARNAFDIPASHYTVCTSSWFDKIKYSVHEGTVCSANGWIKAKGGTFTAFAKNRSGLQVVSFCDNEKYWTQRFVPKSSCDKRWAGLEWIRGGSFWVMQGEGFCVGSRPSAQKAEMRFSRLLAQNDCSGDGFVHEFSFKGFAKWGEEEMTSNMQIADGVSSSRVYLAKSKSDYNVNLAAIDDNSGPHRWTISRGTGDWYHIKVSPGVADDRMFLSATEDGTNVDLFYDDDGSGRQRWSISRGNGNFFYIKIFGGVSNERAFLSASSDGSHVHLYSGDDGSGRQRWKIPGFVAQAPLQVCARRTPLELVKSTPTGTPTVTAGGQPLYNLVEEEVPCYSFLCPRTVFAG